MIITTDMRLAIRSAHKSQKQPTWEEQKAAQQEKILELLNSHPLIKKRVTKAVLDLTQAEEKSHNAYKVLQGLGIDKTLERIRDEDIFTEAGGVLPDPKKALWSYDQVMKEIAGAMPTSVKPILAKYGIIWE